MPLPTTQSPAGYTGQSYRAGTWPRLDDMTNASFDAQVEWNIERALKAAGGLWSGSASSDSARRCPAQYEAL